MPGLMSVTEFVSETREDFSSPTTSTFVNKMPQCRQTISSLEESLDFDRDGLTKMKKAVKAIFNGGNAHIDNEVYLSKALERLGANAMTKDQEPDIGAAFIKFSIVTKELSALMKTLMQNLNNIVMFPLDNILKGDLKGVKGDLKKPFDKAWRDYETKISKIEKEKKQQAKEAGLIRTEISSAEIAEEMDKERKIFQLQMTDYLLKANEIKTKKGVELLQHLVDYYHAQTSYFQDGLKTIEHFNGYISELSSKIHNIKLKQDEERKGLNELKNVLRSSAPFLDAIGLKDFAVKDGNAGSVAANEKKEIPGKGVYNLHQLQGNKHYGYSKSGYLQKKSEGKMRVKVWQKRKCEVKDGYLYISHADESKPAAKVNLLTCQVKTIPDEKRSFDLISCNRTYRFQTEDEAETEAWVSVLINCKEGALKKEFDSNSEAQNSSSKESGSGDGKHQNQSLHELRQTIIKQVQRLPGNDKCVDCNSNKDATWLSTNFGVVTCIECSGIHRDLGVHISRIQSLTLDNIGTSQLLLARVMSNNGFNDIMEATLRQSQKPTAASSMEARYEFIRAKYSDHKFAIRSCSGDVDDLKNDLEHAVQSRHLISLLQVFGEGADLTWTLPGFTATGETGLHVAVTQEDGSSLHIVDFLVQNSSELDAQTKEGNTALHVCVEHNQSECMKLLLRSGANPRLENFKGKTPIDLAKEKSLENMVELLEHAAQNKKSMFENVNIDWNLSPTEDVSTDFSDDDLGDDKLLTKQYYDWLVAGNSNSVKLTPNGGVPSSSGSSSFSRRMRSLTSWEQSNSVELLAYSNSFLAQPTPGVNQADRHQLRSRPSSVVGSESPSSRSSDSSKQAGRRVSGTLAGPPIHQHGGSLKKKAAPAPPRDSRSAAGILDDSSSSNGGSNANIYSHTRTPSDPAASSYPPHAGHHWRQRSVDLVSSSSNGSNISNGSKTIATSKHRQVTNTTNNQVNSNNNSHGHPLYGSLQRPRVPPPPLPPHQMNQKQFRHKPRITNGQSNESLPSLSSEPDNSTAQPLTPGTGNNRLVPLPVPPPRKRHDLPLNGKMRRCQALYDCDADREDELAFKEGEVILIICDKTDDDDWMEGIVEGQPERRGVFPTSFVHMIPD